MIEVNKIKIFISGGVKNGKSSLAQILAKNQEKTENSLYYVATMISFDKEDDERIINHKKEREGLGFNTIEIKNNIALNLSQIDKNSSILVDSLTALLANEMYLKDENIDKIAHKNICVDVKKLCDKFENIVFVSDYIYSDACEYDDYTEDFRKSLGKIDNLCVKNCDIVIQVFFGNMIVHKGLELMNQIYENYC